MPDRETIETLRWRVLEREAGEEYSVFRTERQRCSHAGTKTERTFSILRMPDWVNIIALTRHDNVVLVRQFRHGIEEVTLEIPGGAVDVGESHGVAAERELFEETGYRAKRWIRLGEIQPNPAIQNNTASTWLALDAERVDAPHPDPGEIIAVEEAPLGHMREMLRAGTIKHGIVVAAFAHLLLRTGGEFRRPEVGS